MGWIYILVRTFPFWAFPMAISLLTAVLSKRSSRFLSGKTKIAYVAFAAILGGGSVAFFVFEGPVYAVPAVHDLVHGK